MKCYYSTIPLSGWNKQNDWLGIPYYQGVVEFLLHINKMKGLNENFDIKL
jgi:hypothetical protein